MPTYEICFDPRDPSQSERDSATWKQTDNPALLIARRTVETARECGRPLIEDYWEHVTAQANYCDEPMPWPNLSPADETAAKTDRAICGNSFVVNNPDGSSRRVAPEFVRIGPDGTITVTEP